MGRALDPRSMRDGNEPLADAFVAWLAGEQSSTAADDIGAAARRVSAVAVLDAFEREPAVVSDVMHMLSMRAEGLSLIEALFAEGWERLRGALSDLGPVGSSPSGKAELAVYFLLYFAPDHPLKVSTQQELDFLVRAAHCDPWLLRHTLAWAAAQPAENTGRWRVGDQPVPATMQRWAAQVVWCAFSRCQHHREKVNWVSPEALSLARALIDDDAGPGRIELRKFLDQQMERAYALAALDGGPAALAAADPRMLEEGYFKIDLDATAHPLVASVLHWVPVELDGSDALRVGWAIARELRSKDMPRTPGSVAAVLQRLPEAVEGTVVCGTALLWADIKQLFVYGWKREVEKQGVLARLSRHLRLWPQAWAISARQILTQTGRDSTEVIDLLAMAAAEYDSVHAALEQVTLEDVTSEVRDRAQGVLAKLRGASAPAEELNRWLADQAARAFDGIPMFPHPLTSLSKTWLGAADLEDILAYSVRRAAGRFRPFVQDQGAAAEELLTGVLLGELETAFRDSELLLTAGGRSGLRGVVTVEHRPITKQEEQRWGCDIALLLDAEIPSVVNLQVAELVQVKKSQAFTPRRSARPREAWRIDVPQLRQIMNRSQSSGYWLITSTGEILCVTARWLYGLGRGRDATKQRSFTVGINDVRHHAVPIEQFLPELFLGTWLGTNDEPALEFARGEGGAVIPRHIFKISIAAGRDRQQ